MIRTSVKCLLGLSLTLLSLDSVFGQPPEPATTSPPVQPVSPGIQLERPATLVPGRFIAVDPNQVTAVRSTEPGQAYNYYTEHRYTEDGAGSDYPAPEMILTSELSEVQQKEIAEDLLVLHSLILRHGRSNTQAQTNEVIGYAYTPTPEDIQATRYRSGIDVAGMPLAALGVTLTGRNIPRTRIQYIQGFGAILTYRVPVPLLRPENPAPSDAAKPEVKESEWEAARRQLFSPPEMRTASFSDSALTTTAVGKYDEKRIQSLKEAITKALAQANNIRFPVESQKVLVLLKGSDNATITLANQVTLPASDGGASVRSTTIFEYSATSENPKR